MPFFFSCSFISIYLCLTFRCFFPIPLFFEFCSFMFLHCCLAFVPLCYYFVFWCLLSFTLLLHILSHPIFIFSPFISSFQLLFLHIFVFSSCICFFMLLGLILAFVPSHSFKINFIFCFYFVHFKYLLLLFLTFPYSPCSFLCMYPPLLSCLPFPHFCRSRSFLIFSHCQML